LHKSPRKPGSLSPSPRKPGSLSPAEYAPVTPVNTVELSQTDLAGTPSQMRAFAEVWASNPELVGITRQLIFSDAGGPFNENNTIFGGKTGAAGIFANDLGEHQDHIHLAIEGAPLRVTNGALPVSMERIDHGVVNELAGTTGFEGGQPVEQQIGAPLDQDLGISQGMPGIAENLFKFIANTAMAPVIGALSGVTGVYGTAGPGTGLLGMLSPRQSMYGTLPNVFGSYGPGMLAGPGGFGVSIPGYTPGGMPETVPGSGSCPTQQIRACGPGAQSWARIKSMPTSTGQAYRASCGGRMMRFMSSRSTRADRRDRSRGATR
jgi:hypothetical protein